jgi:hypothetical protein
MFSSLRLLCLLFLAKGSERKDRRFPLHDQKNQGSLSADGRLRRCAAPGERLTEIVCTDRLHNSERSSLRQVGSRDHPVAADFPHGCRLCQPWDRGGPDDIRGSAKSPHESGSIKRDLNKSPSITNQVKYQNPKGARGHHPIGDADHGEKEKCVQNWREADEGELTQPREGQARTRASDNPEK